VKEIEEFITRYVGEHIYHLSLIRNLDSILKLGLLSRNELGKIGVSFWNISNYKVQARREAKRFVLRIKDRDLIVSLYDYVPFYFSPRNPMLYKRREYQDQIAIIAVDSSIIGKPGVIFSDGNAASERTRFYQDVGNLSKLQWDIINSKYWTNFEDGKRIKCAEVLVPRKVNVNLIERIFVYSDEARAKVEEIVRSSGQKIIAEVKKGFYFP